MIAPHAIQRHPSNAQPRLRVLHSGCRRACWAMMMRQARRSSAIQHYTVRCGFLSQRSYVAPSRQRRSSSKRPRKELTYCPIYGFKSFLICAKELTPALFCGRAICKTLTTHKNYWFAATIFLVGHLPPPGSKVAATDARPFGSTIKNRADCTPLLAVNPLFTSCCNGAAART